MRLHEVFLHRLTIGEDLQAHEGLPVTHTAARRDAIPVVDQAIRLLARAHYRLRYNAFLEHLEILSVIVIRPDKLVNRYPHDHTLCELPGHQWILGSYLSSVGVQGERTIRPTVLLNEGVVYGRR